MRKIPVFIMAIALLAGCQGTPRYGGGYHQTEKDQQPRQSRKQTVSKYLVEPTKMGQIIDRYLGKPYAGKGEGQKGYDCSEFVGAVYYEYASIHLPRTTEKLFQTGKKVPRSDLFFGDLVFFDTGGRGVSHVGIYVGFDEFAHASTSNGIIISGLNEKYYKKRFLGARRVLE